MQTRFEERLDQIINSSGPDDINSALDAIGEEERARPPEVVEYDEVETRLVVVDGEETDRIDDYKYSRKILYGLINRGTVALEGALMVARESEHPRAYEVTANIMKNISEMTKDLLELQKALTPVQAPATKVGKQINIQQNFNGAPLDIQNNIKDINNLLDTLDIEPDDE